MEKNLFGKILVLGIIVLFIGVGIQPAIANNVSITTASDSEEDCNLCPKVSTSRFVRLKSLLNRLDTFGNRLSVISKQNSIVEGKYQELIRRIIIFKEINLVLNQVKSPILSRILCGISVNIARILFIPLIAIAVMLVSTPFTEKLFNIYEELIYFPIGGILLELSRPLCEPFGIGIWDIFFPFKK